MPACIGAGVLGLTVGSRACGGGVSGVRALPSSACGGAGVLGLTVGSGACGGGVSGVRAFLSSACMRWSWGSGPDSGE